MPHSAAIFWGESFTVVHNLAWARRRGRLNGQGCSGHESYSGEALSTLIKVIRGRTIKVGTHRIARSPFRDIEA
jgi:hypothetical protein